jgi:hypothetical protein
VRFDFIRVAPEGPRGDHERQILERERLAFRGEVAVRVSGRAPDQRNIDWERLEEQKVLTVDRHQPPDVVGGPFVHLALATKRIDVGARTHARQRSGLARADVTVQLRHHPFGEVVGLDSILDDELFHLWRQAKVAADHAPDQSFVRPIHHHLADRVNGDATRTSAPVG